jgi:hypothetical protein
MTAHFPGLLQAFEYIKWRGWNIIIMSNGELQKAQLAFCYKVAVSIRLYEYGQKQDKLRKERWHFKEIMKFYWK